MNPPARTAAGPRVAARGVVLHDGRLLLVNAWPGHRGGLWCAPGGGQRRGESLPDCLRREIAEETGLSVRVGPPCLVNEFHDPVGGFHQVEVFFRCRISAAEAEADPSWRDPAGVVSARRWVREDVAERLRIKPDSLLRIAWARGFAYDPLEPIQG